MSWNNIIPWWLLEYDKYVKDCADKGEVALSLIEWRNKNEDAEGLKDFKPGT
jgi:hypothetical protein